MTTYLDLASLGPTAELATKRAKLLGLSGTPLSIGQDFQPGDVVICSPRALDFWQDLPEDVGIVSIEDPSVAWLKEEQGLQSDRPYTHNIVDSEAKIEEFLSKLSGCDKLGIDTESDQAGETPHEMRDRLVGVGVACGDECYYGLASYEPWMVALREHLAGKPWVGWNAKWDISLLRRHGVTPGPLVGDGMLAAYLAGEPNARLKDVVQRRLGYRMTTYDEIVGTGKNRIPISQVDIDRVASYCCADAYFAVKAEELLRLELSGKALNLYENVDLPIATILCDMQAEGIRFDRGAAEETLEGVQERMQRLEVIVDELVRQDGWCRPDRTWTCRTCRNGSKKKLTCDTCNGQGMFSGPQPVNLGSSDQLAAFYHDHLGLPVQKISRETGKPSMDALALLRMERLHPTISLILTWKRQQKYSQFLEQWIATVQQDGRIHTSFSNALVRSHRFSSSGPNLQQVKLEWRHLFIADQGKALVAADYAQIEVRIVAYASHDLMMLKIVQADPNTEDGDIHARNVWALFGVIYGDQHRYPALRVRAKNYLFGALYGSKGDEVHAVLEKQILEDPSLAGLGIPTTNEIRKGIAGIRDIYGRYFYEWVPFELEQIRANNNVSLTLYGRPRKIPNLASRDKQEREAAEREAINHIIQGTAADILRLAMLKVCKLQYGKLLLSVHDELLSEVDKDKAEWYAKEMKEAMELGQPFEDVPLVVDVTIGQDWQSCHKSTISS